MNSGRFYINGEWVTGSVFFQSTNPNTGKPFGNVPNAQSNEVDAAVSAAKAAFKNWCETSLEKRKELLNKVASLLIEEYGEEGKTTPLKELIKSEVGKRLPEADIEVIESSDMLSFYAENAEKYLAPRTLSLNQDLWAAKNSKIYFEPKGVVAIIKAWNYPLEVPIWAIAPALMAGNTIVFKPSEHSSFVAMKMIELFEKAGFPKGVLNLITGDESCGKLLVEHKDIAMVSFTGSVKVGEEINQICAKKLIKCSLELSGNDAAIVNSDADIELTANGLVWGAFCNSGQVCVGIKRCYVHKDIAPELIQLVVNKTKEMRAGIDYGPIISELQLQQIENFVKDAKEKGANILTGGTRITDKAGYYFSPTVLSGVTNNMHLINQECFGNLLPFIEFENIEEAIYAANNSKYGLGASIWSSNKEFSENLSRKIDAGMVWVNDVNVAFPEAPWGGVKHSGSGIDLSEFSFYEYVNYKHVNTDNSGDKRRIWWYPYSE